MSKKTLQDLTIKDPFMFAAVMSDAENCLELLKMVLDIPIDHVEVSSERSFTFRPEYHGVRLDVFAKDEAGSRYNVEMQIASTSIERRTRYYHAHMDMDALLAGHSYEELPESYVIFICDYDPFGGSLYRYTVDQLILENGKRYADGRHSIFLSTKGTNVKEVSPALVSFLDFVHSDLERSRELTEDSFVSKLQRSIDEIKKSREMEVRYMLFEDMLRMEHKEGREEGREEGLQEGMQKGMQKGMLDSILLILSEKFPISPVIEKAIRQESDPDTLKAYLKAAASAETADQFLAVIKKQHF